MTHHKIVMIIMLLSTITYAYYTTKKTWIWTHGLFIYSSSIFGARQNLTSPSDATRYLRING